MATKPSAAPSALRVAIVGRVNVGKSTLFNRLTERRDALVSPEPGTTRDRREGLVEWRGASFILIDTGGVETPRAQPPRDQAALPPSRLAPPDNLRPLVAAQTERAIAHADLALLVADARDGLLPQDRRWAERLRGRAPRTLVVVNKVDSASREHGLADFFSLGLGAPLAVSAATGRGTGDLLDRIVRELRGVGARRGQRRRRAEPTKPLTVAILGQPNSGKSTLLNAILGEERVITHHLPHTTREPQDIPAAWRGRPFLLIDTAGIRRRAHVTAGVEAAGVEASLKTIARADVVLLLIDLTRGPTSQDQRLARYIADHGKGLVLVLNKWDLIPQKTAATMRATERRVRALLPGLPWAPLVVTSALTKQRVAAVLEAALDATTAAGAALDEETLAAFLRTVVKRRRPTRGRGVRHPKILSLKQVRRHPPRFELVAVGELHPSYLKFLENRLREHFGFTGTPVSITLKAKRPRVKSR